MGVKSYRKNEIIFRQGDAAQSMYSIAWGRVGIFLDYGTAKEKKLADLYTDDFFGEMGLVDHMPRSATAVALEQDTQLEEITEESLGAIFRENPPRVTMIMQTLSQHLRKLTKEYMAVCKAARDVAAQQDGQENKELTETVDSLMEHHSNLPSYCS